MKSAQSIQEQRRAFLGWVDRWYRLSNSKNINLETQGAINAYQKTPEGQRLSKDVIEMGLKLKMKPANLDLPEEFCIFVSSVLLNLIQFLNAFYILRSCCSTISNCFYFGILRTHKIINHTFG